MVIRVPNLPTGEIVDDKRMATDDELTFRHTLISQLQNNFGPEGCIIPTQTDAASPNDFIKQIQNNVDAQGNYTCGFGRFLYDATNNRILVSIDGGGGVPAFMTVTLTVPIPAV